jgi:hypothetical protein
MANKSFFYGYAQTRIGHQAKFSSESKFNAIPWEKIQTYEANWFM